jgi:ABC-type transport system substrate-binding protein
LPVEKLGEASKYYKHDIKYAKQLLAEAGYPNGVELPFIARSRQNTLEQILLHNGSLLKAGIKLKIQVMDNAEWLIKAYIGKYEGASAGNGPGAVDAGEFLWLAYHPASELYNTSHVNDAFVSKLVEEQRRTLDKNKRKKIIQDLELYLAEKMYYVPFANGMDYELVNARLRGYMPSTSQNYGDAYRYLWIEDAK